MSLSPRTKKFISGMVDFGWPLGLIIGFLVTGNMVQATWGLVIGAGIALAVGYAFERRLAPMPLVAGVLALIFGGLTLLFDDPRFVYVKPTVTSAAFGLFLIGGMLMGKSPLKVLLNSPSLTLLAMPDEAWAKLTWRYGLFFLVMAGINEAVWRTQPQETWLLFRFPGATILHVIFGVSQTPLMMKYAKTDEIPPPPVE